ncbi:hypothetical protein ZWY2020_035066 [Hordeum vulgare]|nr:hypothetical protein ZWY2020_035066 [Hordeum vulgare]
MTWSLLRASSARRRQRSLGARVRVRAPVAALAGDGGCAGTGMEQQHLQAGGASGSPGSWERRTPVGRRRAMRQDGRGRRWRCAGGEDEDGDWKAGDERWVCSN